MGETPVFQPPPNKEWVDVVREAVREEIYNHFCRLASISDDELKDISHMVGMITDLGAGETRAGVEVMRANHSWLLAQRERTEQFGRAFFFVVSTSVVGGIAAALWYGFKALLKVD